MYGHSKGNMPRGDNKARQHIQYIVYYVYLKLQKHTYVVTHLLSERVLFTHWMGVVLIQGILAHWKGVVLFFSHLYDSMRNRNGQKRIQGIP